MSSKDWKTRFESQFCRMNCQMFSWPLSSGARGGSGISKIVARELESLGAVPPGLIEKHDRMRAWRNLGGDFVEMQLHGLAIAGRQHQGGAGPAFGADRPEQIGRLGALIVSGAGA